MFLDFIVCCRFQHIKPICLLHPENPDPEEELEDLPKKMHRVLLLNNFINYLINKNYA